MGASSRLRLDESPKSGGSSLPFLAPGSCGALPGRPSKHGVVDGPQPQRVNIAAGSRYCHRGHPSPRGVEGRVRESTGLSENRSKGKDYIKTSTWPRNLLYCFSSLCSNVEHCPNCGHWIVRRIYVAPYG